MQRRVAEKRTESTHHTGVPAFQAKWHTIGTQKKNEAGVGKPAGWCKPSSPLGYRVVETRGLETLTPCVQIRVENLPPTSTDVHQPLLMWGFMTSDIPPTSTEDRYCPPYWLQFGYSGEIPKRSADLLTTHLTAFESRYVMARQTGRPRPWRKRWPASQVYSDGSKEQLPEGCPLRPGTRTQELHARRRTRRTL